MDEMKVLYEQGNLQLMVRPLGARRTLVYMRNVQRRLCACSYGLELCLTSCIDQVRLVHSSGGAVDARIHRESSHQLEVMHLLTL